MTAALTIKLTRDALFERVWREPLSVMALQLGLSAGGLAKICDRTANPYPSRGHLGKAKGGRAPLPSPLLPAPPRVEKALRVAPGQTVSPLPLEERRATDLVRRSRIASTGCGIRPAMYQLRRMIWVSGPASTT